MTYMDWRIFASFLDDTFADVDAKKYQFLVANYESVGYFTMLFVCL